MGSSIPNTDKGKGPWVIITATIIGALITGCCALIAASIGLGEGLLPWGNRATEGDRIDVGGNVEDSTIIQSEGDVNIDIQPTLPEFEEFSNELDSVGVEGGDHNVLVSYNASGFPIWRHQLDTRITKADIADLDGDGTREIVVGLHEPGPMPGWIQIYDEAGELITEYNVWEESIYIGGAKEASNIIDFEVVDLDGSGQIQIVIIANDTYWYASTVSVLEYAHGTLSQVARYWNPGLLYSLNIADLEGDGIREVVVTGVNNDLQAVFSVDGNVHSVFMFHGDNISGQAPPGFGSGPGGSQAWYGFVTPSNIAISEIDFEDFNGDGMLEVQVALEDVCSFYVNVMGDVVGYGRGTACQGESELSIIR